MLETCDSCRKDTRDTTIQWVPDDGWRAVCEECRGRPVLLENGRIHFIRVGGE